MIKESMKEYYISVYCYNSISFCCIRNDGCLPKILLLLRKPSADGISNSALPNGSVFVDHTLSMEGFVVRDNENVAATDYNYLRAMDELAFQLSLTKANISQIRFRY